MTHKTYLLLGSNLGDRKLMLKNAAAVISQKIGVIESYSSIYETLAWGIEDQPAFLNQVIKVETSLHPQKLLTTINGIEKELGRVRHQKWGERLIDIDILYYNEDIIETENLVIPHPEIINRRFTLIPLAEIAPNYIHPIIKKNQSALLEICPDKLEVKNYS